MNPFHAVLLFFSGEDYWDLNIYVVVIIEVVFCLSLAFQVHQDTKHERLDVVKKHTLAWIAAKAIIAGALAFASIKIAIAIGLYVFMAAGIASMRLVQRSVKTAWKVLHGLAAVFLLFMVPAALFSAGLLLDLTVELLFGAGGGILSIISNARGIGSVVRGRKATERARISSRGWRDAARAEKVAFITATCLLGVALVGIPVTGMVVEDVMVTMRDGTRIATTVYKPSMLIGGLPTVLIRTPYGRTDIADWGASWYSKGYVVVIQDVRGTHDSEGTFDALVSAGTDGHDTCGWIASQPWSNGRIGSVGGSALGMAQYFAAGAGSPGLLSQSIDVGTADIYDAFFRGGKYAECDIGTWIWMNSGGSYATIDAFLAHPVKDSWWNNASLSIDGDFARVTTRAVHVAGWFDVFQQNTIDAFRGFYYGGAERARGHQKLVIGPWVHAWGGTYGGQIAYPGGDDHPAGRWGNAILAEGLEPAKLSNGMLHVQGLWEEPNVAYYVMGDVLDPNCGANEWRFANDWPVPHTDTPLHLHGDGALAWDVPITSRNFSYVYDPQIPMQTIGGTNLVFNATYDLPYDPTKAHPVSIGWGTRDQRPLLDRPDVLVFNTSALPSPLEVAGNVKARFWISSNCTDTDFVAKLCDVYPDGRSMLVCDGIVSVRKRNGLDKDELIVAGNVYEVEVDLWSTAYQFNAGHRLQLVVSSSNAPKYQPCPNTGAPIARTYGSTAVANNTLLVGPSWRSRLILPIVA